MRLQNWRLLVAVAAGVVSLSGPVSAQNSNPTGGLGSTFPVAPPVPQSMGAATVNAQPAPGPTAPTVPSLPAAAAGTPVPPSKGAVVVQGNGGCTNGGSTTSTGTGVRGFVMSASGGYYGTNCQTGLNCNNGCGSVRSDCAFMFGSCKTYFSPCGPLQGASGGSCGLFGGCGLFGKCFGNPVGGRSPCNPFNPCHYDSYASH